MKRCSIALFILVCIIIGCEQKSNISVTIQNNDKFNLDSVVIVVTGNSYRIGAILPSDSIITKVHPHGESHLEIEFTSANKNKKRLIVGTYFESGYSGFIRVGINSDSIVSVIDSISISKY